VTLLVGCAVAPLGAARFFDPVFQVFDRPWRAAPVAIVAGALSVFGSVLALALFTHPVLPLITVYGLSGAAYLMLGLWMSRDVLPPLFVLDIPLLRAIVALSLPIGVGGLATAVNARIGTFVLERLQSSAAVAELVTAGKPVELSAVAAVTLCTPLLPILVGSINRPGGLNRASARILELLAALIFPAAILAWHLAPSLITLVYGPGYSGAGETARILVLQLILIPFSLVTSGILLAKGVTRQAYWNGAVAALVNLALNLMLVPTMAARGSAIAAVSAELSMLAVASWFVYRTVGNVIVPRRWAKIALLCAVMIGLVAHPLVANAWANDLLAAALYAALALFGGAVSRVDLATLFGHTGDQPASPQEPSHATRHAGAEADTMRSDTRPAAIAEPTRLA
jgi:O-antigen/teichoic acid export membrane protein